ncbi:MAG: hypothetical protein ACM3U2_07975 [Deltaproteobacteria bacterium]
MPYHAGTTAINGLGRDAALRDPAGLEKESRPSLPLGRDRSGQVAVLVMLGAGGLGALAGDWLAGAGILLLWLAVRLLRSREGPPVLVYAFAFQWLQVVAGVVYCGIFNRQLRPSLQCDYRPMVLLGLVSLLVLLFGLAAGRRWAQGRRVARERPLFAFGLGSLLLAYVASVVAAQVVLTLGWSYARFAQAAVALSQIRYLFLYLVLRRLFVERHDAFSFVVIAVFEIAFGFTSYFAGFREAIMLALLAAVERFDPRRPAHWRWVAAIGIVLGACGLVWTGVKGQYRAEWKNAQFGESRLARLSRIIDLSRQWIAGPYAEKVRTVDALVDRVWSVYYPALALKRVPESVPHESGALEWDAVRHVLTPRFFFPDKPAMVSDSVKVRKYSGVAVAGPDQGVSIAFGYVAESYVDFGIPGMFVPIFLWGVAMGFGYEFFLNAILHRELAIAFVATTFWLSLFLFERSWVGLLGRAGMVFIILGGTTFLLDRFILSHRTERW